jgi:hypothetical protein
MFKEQLRKRVNGKFVFNGGRKSVIIKPCPDCGKLIDKRSSYCRSCFQKGDRNHSWVGDKVGYFALHQWIRKYYGSPKKCDHCGITDAKHFEWANISKKYLRDRSNYIRLRSHCHHLYDDMGNKAWITKRKLYGQSGHTRSAWVLRKERYGETGHRFPYQYAKKT